MTAPELPESGIFPIPAAWGVEWKEVTGVYIGRCVDGSELDVTTAAHYHKPGMSHLHWICVRHPRDVYYIEPIEYDLTDRPSATMLHELAHVLTDSSHTAMSDAERYRWADKLHELLKAEGIPNVPIPDRDLAWIRRIAKRAGRSYPYSKSPIL